MKNLTDISRTFKEFGERAIGAMLGPTRDELVSERDMLRANAPTEYIDVTAPLPLPTWLCSACSAAHQGEVERRARYQAHGARVAVLEGLLFRMTFGSDDERDDPGRALADLRAEVRRAAEAHHSRSQRWERGVEHDRRGRPIRAWSTVQGLVEVGEALSALGRAVNELTNRTRAEVLSAIPELRRRLLAAMAMPLERPIDADAAQRAGLRPPPPGEAERLGLHPGGSNILGGTVRFARSDSQ